MMLRKFTSRLRADCQGSMVVEFALLAPVFFTMVLGVLHVGFALQNYNAMRSLSADVARYAVIAHQSGNTMTASQLRTYAITEAQGAPYLLKSDRINASVTTPTTRVTGAIEFQLTITYQTDNMLEFTGIEAPYLIYTRPIFVIDNAAA